MPRMVCSSLLSNGPSSFARRRLIATSTTLASLSKLMSQTSSAMAVFDKISPWRRASTLSSENSLAVRSRRCPARVALRAIRSIHRSATWICKGSWMALRRVSACRRATSSRNENGLPR